MSRRSTAGTIGSIVIDRLEDRRLMSAVVPVITQTNLVSDGAVAAQHVDPNLVNPWGIAITNTGNIWVADNGSAKTTFYDQAGNPQSLVVSIPGPGGGSGAAPTGVVFNKSHAFKVAGANGTAPSEYIFAGEDGTISGWAPAADLNNAILAVDHSGTHDVFKGLALLGSKIYATDFHNNRIEEFTNKFALVTNKPGAFTDPTLPAGYAPFGIQAIGSRLFVTYALQNGAAHDDLSGAGHGFIDEFSGSGKMVKRFASAPVELNSPWAVTTAPSKWGKYKSDILVGNFGDGHITVFDKKGNVVGQLADANGTMIAIDGLWGLTPGLKTAKQELFFAAGINEESDGLFGTLTATLPTVTRAVAVAGGVTSGATGGANY